MESQELNFRKEGFIKVSFINHHVYLIKLTQGEEIRKKSLHCGGCAIKKKKRFFFYIII